MVVDRSGHTAATGDVYLVAGTLRRIEASTDLLLVLGGSQQLAIRVAPADVCLVDTLLADFTQTDGDLVDGAAGRVPKPLIGNLDHVLLATTPNKWGQVKTGGITDDAVTNGKLRNSSALSVIGRSANSTGDPADIAAGSDGDVLRRSGTTVGFGTIVTAGIADAAVTLAKMANLAQDQFIGRVTASTGVPETATITAAARGVLDDTTVAAMRASLGIVTGVLTKTSGSSWTTKANTTLIFVELVGAGGGGGGANQGASKSAGGGGGASGGYASAWLTVTPSTSYSFAIGAAGTAGSSAGGNGGNGGDTTLTVGGTTVTAKGGLGGTGCAAITLGVVAGGAGQLSTSGDLNGGGAPGQGGVVLSGTVAISGNGGSSPWGGGGPGQTAETVGVDGIGYGAGGGGGCCLGTTKRAGGAGTQGAIRITEYAS